MIIWGRIIACSIGYMLYGPIGVLLGFIFGQIFDKGLVQAFNGTAHSAEVRALFFKTVFETMGYLAKADGVVSENQLRVARQIMQRDFNLNPEQTMQAMLFFGNGKQADYDLSQALHKFNSACGQHTELKRLFLEMQLKLVLADGLLRPAALQRLQQVCMRLGLDINELDYLLQGHHYTSHYQTNWQSSYNSRNGYAQSDSYKHSSTNSRTTELLAAYKLLGVTAEDNTKTVKAAYRRLVSKYHPDKMMAKGLPAEMLTMAKEKTQALTVAYDLIMRSRE